MCCANATRRPALVWVAIITFDRFRRGNAGNRAAARDATSGPVEKEYVVRWQRRRRGKLSGHRLPNRNLQAERRRTAAPLPCKPAVGFNADQRRNTLNLNTPPGSDIYADQHPREPHPPIRFYCCFTVPNSGNLQSFVTRA